MLHRFCFLVSALFLSTFSSLTSALTLPDELPLEEVASGYRSLEGPAWSDHEQALYFSNQDGNFGLHCYTEANGAQLFADYTAKVNGNLVLTDGSLITCESGARRLVRRTPGGGYEVLVDAFEGAPLNQPNDVVEAPDGTLWFTTPQWPANDQMFVFAYDPATSELRKMVEGIVQPNGLGFSPDGQWFYLNAFGERRVIRYPYSVTEGLGPGETFIDNLTGGPDGLKVDHAGNLYVFIYDEGRADSGLNIYRPDGTKIRHLLVPGNTTNGAFGGPHRQDLFITSGSRLYRLDLSAAYPVAKPKLTLTRDETTVSLAWESFPGLRYWLETSPEMETWTRQALFFNAPPEGGPMATTVPKPAEAKQFHRLVPVWRQ